MAYSFGVGTIWELEAGSLSSGRGGGRNPIGDVGGGSLVPGPKSFAIANSAPGQFLLTFVTDDRYAMSVNKARWYRVYYLNAREISVSDVSNAAINPLVTPNYYPFQSGTAVTGKRHFVIDVPVASGSVTTATISSAPYLNGGWFYVVGVNMGGQEGGGPLNPVQLPIALSYSSPDTEVTNVAAPFTLMTINGLQYAAFTFSWKTNTGAVTFPTKYVQIFINNYANKGVLAEGPVYNTATVGGATSTGTYLIECDRGTGGFPDPGSHTVTFYFVSLSASYSHRADPTSAPSVALATGIH